MTDPVFGIAIRKIDDEARPVIAADLSTIGIIGPSSGADASLFPINDPVHYDSNQLYDLADQLGTAAGGYLLDAIRGINDQLGETQFAARLVVVRTEEGTDADPAIKVQQTIANIMGDSVQQTGVWAFLKASPKLGFTPRIIVAPGYTGQMANSVDVLTRVVAGTDYVEDDEYTLTFTGGGADAVQATATARGLADGSLGDVTFLTYGAWYESAPTVEAEKPGKNVTAAPIHAGNEGSGYQVGDTIQLPYGVEITVATVNGDAFATGTITNSGFRHGTTPTNPVAQVSTSGQGVGAAFDLTWSDHGTTATFTATVAEGANPICAALTPVLNQLMGVAFVESAGTSQQNDEDWRETIQSERLIPLSGGVKVMDPDTGNVVSRPLAPRAAGILCRRDHEKGAPFHSAANQPVQGIVAPLRNIPFYLTDAANEAQELLGFNIGCVVRGELGDDFAIASGGFVLLTTDTAAEDTLWKFYNVRRGRDFIHLGMLRALRFYLGRYNITGHTIQAVLNTMGNFLRDLKADGHILGYQINFNATGNSADEIRLGHLTVGFMAEEPPVLTRLTIESARYRKAIDAMVADLAAQLNIATS